MKLTCQDYQALFSEYYDGYEPRVNLTDGITLGKFEAHLQKCAVCAEEYKKYSQLLDEVWELPEPEVPPGFYSSLMEYVEAHKHEDVLDFPKIVRNNAKRGQPMYRKVVAFTASVAVMAASLLLVMSIFGFGELGRTPNVPVEPIAHIGAIETFDPVMAYESTPFIEDPFYFPGARVDADLFNIEVYGVESFGIEAFGAEEYIPISPAIVFFDDLELQDLELQYEYQYTPQPSRNNTLTIISISLFAVGAVGAIILVFDKQKRGKRKKKDDF